MTSTGTPVVPVRPSAPDLVGPLLAALDAAPSHEAVELLESHLADAFDVRGVWLWLADYGGTDLGRLRRDLTSAVRSVPVDGSAAGTAFRRRAAVRVQEGGGGSKTVYIPVVVRSEHIGVLEVLGGDRPLPEEPLLHVGTALGYVLLAARRHTDQFEAVRRRHPMELPAEMQWEMLPVLAHDGPDFAVAGRLEPAYEIGGDLFDYAAERDHLTLALTDAMGHGTHAAIMSTLSVGALRNARRQGLGVRQQARAVNTVLHDHFGPTSGYITGLVARVARADGAAEVVVAGHPMPFVLRDGRVLRWELEPDLPLGLFADTEYRAQSARMEPGDRLLLFSDGITEAAPDGGEQFGADRVADHLRTTSDLAPPEVVRLLTTSVMTHRAGLLSDDATVLCLDYRR